jgi:hypothetical protein
MLEILLIQAFKSLSVELVPFFQVLEPGTFIFDNEMCMSRTECVPDANFLV